MALTKTQVSKLYVAIFGRASEGEGNSYWQKQAGNISSIANKMLATQAAKDYFGTTLNNNQSFIEFIYKNTLNKTYEQDPNGIKYWTSLLDKGTSKGDVVNMMIEAIDSYAPGGKNYNANDTITQKAYNQFINRVEVSNYTADNVAKAPSDYTKSMSFNKDLVVTDSKTTLQNAKTNIDKISSSNLNEYDYEFLNGTFTNTGKSDIVLTDLGFNVSGNLTVEGEYISFTMKGTFEKGISVSSNVGNEKISGFDFPDQVLSTYDSIYLNDFLPTSYYMDIPDASGTMDMELSIYTTVGVFTDDVMVYI